MKKGTILGIVCSVIALILLAALAVFLAWQFHNDAFSDDDTQAAIAADAAIRALYQADTESGPKTGDEAETQATDEETDRNGTDTPAAGRGTGADRSGASDTGKDVDAKGDAPQAEPETSGTEAQTEFVPLEVYDVSFPIIWVGDSRTLGMERALDTTDTYIGKDGEGYNWFLDEGLALTADAIAAQPDAPVVLNFGVNDYDNLANYLALYTELLAAYPDTHFYFLSVNPIEPTLCSNISNEQIADFNSHLKESFPDAYIDSFTLLMIDQVMPIDGVHYSAEDYQKIYNFAARQIESREEESV